MGKLYLRTLSDAESSENSSRESSTNDNWDPTVLQTVTQQTVVNTGSRRGRSAAPGGGSFEDRASNQNTNSSGHPGSTNLNQNLNQPQANTNQQNVLRERDSHRSSQQQQYDSQTVTSAAAQESQQQQRSDSVNSRPRSGAISPSSENLVLNTSDQQYQNQNQNSNYQNLRRRNPQNQFRNSNNINSPQDSNQYNVYNVTGAGSSTNWTSNSNYNNWQYTHSRWRRSNLQGPSNTPSNVSNSYGNAYGNSNQIQSQTQSNSMSWNQYNYSSTSDYNSGNLNYNSNANYINNLDNLSGHGSQSHSAPPSAYDSSQQYGNFHAFNNNNPSGPSSSSHQQPPTSLFDHDSLNVNNNTAVTPGPQTATSQSQNQNQIVTVTDNPNFLLCKFCDTQLSVKRNIISRDFHGTLGPALLLSNVINISLGPTEDRDLLTGKHRVCDISCITCNNILGWRYTYAAEPSQRYKCGKYILERTRVGFGINNNEGGGGWGDS